MRFQARKENIVVQTANDETMVYDLTADRAYLLNETSAFVWQMCDGTHDLSKISRALAEKTKQPINEDIVKLAIDQLRANGLLDEAEQTKDYFTKTSRRKVIKQVGRATMIALPVIFSLTAPAAAHAASGRGNIAACQPCTAPYQCYSGKCFPQPYGGAPICSDGVNSPAHAPGSYVGNFPGSCVPLAGNCCSNSARGEPFFGSYACYCN